ncbi:MAG: hypothetical protein JJW01_03130 [Alphaproteobacteria bacterium]|nr:hypothetical protein [Rickettsiales bacterium]
MSINNIGQILQSILICNTKEIVNLEPNWRNAVGVYVSVPNTSKVPYVKINGLTKRGQPLIDDSSFSGSFNISIFDNDKNNQQSMDLLYTLYVDLPTILIGKVKNGISIVNAIPSESSVIENLQTDSWVGNFEMMLICNKQ